jgi:hypothetical protein
MEQMSFNTAQMADNRIATERLRAGFSVSELTFEVNRRLPRPLRVSGETMRKYEKGAFPKAGANPVLVAAIADALDVPVRKIDSGAEAQLDEVLALFRHSRERSERLSGAESDGRDNDRGE